MTAPRKIAGLNAGRVHSYSATDVARLREAVFVGELGAPLMDLEYAYGVYRATMYDPGCRGYGRFVAAEDDIEGVGLTSPAGLGWLEGRLTARAPKILLLPRPTLSSANPGVGDNAAAHARTVDALRPLVKRCGVVALADYIAPPRDAGPLPAPEVDSYVAAGIRRGERTRLKVTADEIADLTFASTKPGGGVWHGEPVNPGSVVHLSSLGLRSGRLRGELWQAGSGTFQERMFVPERDSRDATTWAGDLVSENPATSLLLIDDDVTAAGEINDRVRLNAATLLAEHSVALVEVAAA